MQYNQLASQPKHLCRQIVRCLRVFTTATTTTLVQWAYGNKKRARWMAWNVRRCCRQWGCRVVGRQGRMLIWALPLTDERAFTGKS
jgi:hypothetical protein